MKLLCLHSDFLEFEPVSKALKEAEEVEKAKKRVEECLVCFACVEKGDEKNIDEKAAGAVSEIEGIANQIKVRRIVLYPFVHLSSTPATPGQALAVLKKTEEILASKGYETSRAPFGWYKKFVISCKGHPLSEWSREVGGGKMKKEQENIALQKEQELVSEWFVLDPQEKTHKISMSGDKPAGFDFSKFPGLEKLARYEMKKVRIAKEEPIHTKLMRELEIADYEPASDSGNLRYYPNGRLIKSLLEEYVTENVIKYGGMEVETPIMYDMNHPVLAKYMARFPARQYVVASENKELFLRFAACFGQFMMAKDMPLSYKCLPAKLYEMSRYSFRREKSGEVVGLKRLRAFTMPDCHAICADMEQARDELQKRFKLCRNVLKGIGIEDEDYEMAIRFTKEFYENNKECIMQLVKSFGKPVLAEMWDKQFFYFVLKYEFNFVDSQDKACALSTDQIDIENAKNYGIQFMGSDGQKHLPVILHCSPSGAIERIMCALLEKAGMQEKKGKPPCLPFWLSPSQARLCPVSDAHIKFCEEIADRMQKENIRVDIDDRTESISNKVRKAEMDWVPYVLVVGEKEKESKKFQVRVRKDKSQKNVTLEQLMDEIKHQMAGMPSRPRYLPREISKRPIFVG